MLLVNGQVFLLPPPLKKFNSSTTQSAPEHTDRQYVQKGMEKDDITAEQDKVLTNQQQKEFRRS